MAPEVSEKEGSYTSCFYRWFLESSKSCLLLLVALPSLIDTLTQLLAWRALLWLSMTWRQRYLAQSIFLSATSLAWSLILHWLFCFSQEKPLRWEEIHTHTHRHTRTQTWNSSNDMLYQVPKNFAKQRNSNNGNTKILTLPNWFENLRQQDDFTNISFQNNRAYNQGSFI